ncbi:MAG: DUF3024 domain-containing protein [bacterium]|nr:DUF3024 domain-containing protein [bacterium]
MNQDQTISKIEKLFKAPERVADKIQNEVEKVRGGYTLIETRPRWDGSPGPWTRIPIAKIIFHKPSGMWKVYWHRASGAWNLYSQFKSLDGALKLIRQDKHGCFWG